MEAKKPSNFRLWTVGAITVLTFPVWAVFVLLAFIFYGIPVAIGSEVRDFLTKRAH